MVERERERERNGLHTGIEAMEMQRALYKLKKTVCPKVDAYHV